MKHHQNQEEVLLSSLGPDQFIEINVDHQTEWMRKILSELQEDVVDELREDPERVLQASLSFKGDLQKRSNSMWRDYALLVGELKAHFWTQCVKSGELMMEDLDVDVQAIFVNESLKESKNLEETDTLMIESYEYDLYFYKASVVCIFDVLHEQLFLNKEPYPVKTRPEGETF